MVRFFSRWRVFISLAVTQDLQIHLERLLILKAFNVASETESDSQQSNIEEKPLIEGKSPLNAS